MNAPELAQRAGISYRQLDYWIRKGWIDGTNPGTGYVRRFAEEDAARVMMMAKLIAAGLHPARAAELCGWLLETGVVRLGPGLLVKAAS